MRTVRIKICHYREKRDDDHPMIGAATSADSRTTTNAFCVPHNRKACLKQLTKPNARLRLCVVPAIGNHTSMCDAIYEPT